jgi:DNA-binding NarL/FixJ family response regulator
MNKIILVDDHAIFREGIKLLIENEGLGKVIAEAANGQVLLNLLKTLQPDLIIMDIEMPVMDGLIATREALKIKPELKILVLTMLNDKTNYFEMTNAGVCGFVLKTAGKKEFEKAINTVVRGECYFSNDVLRQIILKMDNGEPILKQTDWHFEKLSSRETEVLRYFCEGLTVSEIASKLFISVKTVESHRSALLKKTNTKNTINLVLFAIKNKLVSI